MEGFKDLNKMSEISPIEISERSLEDLCNNLISVDPIMKGLSEIMGKPQVVLCEYTLNKGSRLEYLWTIGKNSEMTYDPRLKHETECKCDPEKKWASIESSITLKRFVPGENSLNFEMKYLFDQKKYFIAVLGFNGILGKRGNEAIVETVIRTEIVPIVESFNYFRRIKSACGEVSTKRFIRVFKTTLDHLQRLEKANTTDYKKI